ncbi:MAG: group I truncated hemoglobin [Myxococcaceae bacterium]
MRLEVRLLSLALSLLAACATTPSTPSGPESAAPKAASTSASGATLYQRLGGRDVIDAFVATFVANVGHDPRIQLRFLFTDLDGLRGHLSAQICEASGGPCKYTGKAMKPGHAGMHIQDAEFDAMAEDLVAALNAHGIGAAEQKELLAVVGSMRLEIVEARQ